MRRLIFIIVALVLTAKIFAQTGKVGINTNTPQAMLHVKDSSVLFSGGSLLSGGLPPVSGPGIRMMWYPEKAAFRSGYAGADEWNRENIGNYSFAAGISPIAKGPASMATGDECTALAPNSLAAGFRSTAAGYHSAAIGFQVVSNGFGCLAVGMFNDPVVVNPQTAGSTAGPVFLVGNGSSTDPSNALTVLRNGYIGINTPSPQAALHLKGISPSSFDSHIRLETVGSSDYATMVYDGDMKFRTFGAVDNYQWRNSANNTRMVLTDGGDLIIDGSLSQSSDARLKKQIHPLQNSLQKLLQINGYHYQWTDSNRSPSLQTGVLAQEVLETMPELVSTNADGVLRVNYTGLIPYMIEAISELKAANDLLKQQIKFLQNTKRNK